MLEDIDEANLMNGPGMAEAPEPILAMVCALAALANATVRKAILRGMEQCAIHFTPPDDVPARTRSRPR